MNRWATKMCVFQWQNRWQLLNLQICQITFGSSISFSIWQADEAFEEGVLLAGAHLVRWRSSLTTRPSRKKEVFVFTMSYPSVLQCHKTEPTIQTKKVIGFQILSRFDLFIFIFFNKAHCTTYKGHINDLTKVISLSHLC